jgi:hypothetical protein
VDSILDTSLIRVLMVFSYVSINKGGSPPTFQNVGLVSNQAKKRLEYQ